MRTTTLMTALLAALCASAAMPARMPKSALQGAQKMKMIPDVVRIQREAPGDDEPVLDQPEGKLEYYARDCMSYSAEYYEATRSMNYGSVVKVVTAADGEVWLGHTVAEYPTNGWVKAQREGDKLTVNLPQPIDMYYDWYEDDYYTLYLVPLQAETVEIDGEEYSTFVPADDMTVTFTIKADGSVTADKPEIMLGACTWGYDPTSEDEEAENYVWSGFGDTDITATPEPEKTLVVPDITPEKWVWADPYEYGFANVIVDGNDIYVAGMDRTLPDAYIKGTIEGDQAIFPSGQFLGADLDFSVMYMSYFTGAEIFYEEDPDTGWEVMMGSPLDAAIFSYDAEAKTLTLENGYVISSSDKVFYPIYGYDDVMLAYQERNPETVPDTPYDLVYDPESWGDPIINVIIPPFDAEGNLLDTNNLFYELYIDGELYTFTGDLYWPDVEGEMTLVPYSLNGYCIYASGDFHTIYMYMPIESSIGVRSVYINENGDALYSEMETILVEGTGVDAVESEVAPVSVEYYDIAGRRISNPEKGIAIRIARFADGTMKTDKVVMR